MSFFTIQEGIIFSILEHKVLNKILHINPHPVVEPCPAQNYSSSPALASGVCRPTHESLTHYPPEQLFSPISSSAPA